MWVSELALLSVRCSIGGAVFAMDLPEDSDVDLQSWSQVGDRNGDRPAFMFGPATEYEPSLLSDFSEMLPTVSGLPCGSLSEDYSPELVVQSAWKSLPSKEPELPWEGGFWDNFLNPNVSAMDMLSKGIKRPAPFHAEPLQPGVKDTEVDNRVMAKQTVEIKIFLQHIRDVPIRTWKEEREAIWETAIRRWVILLDQWDACDNPLLVALQSKTVFVEKAQIMVDVFYNKAPQTLMKRVNSLLKLCGTLHGQGVVFPCTEEQFYVFLKNEAQMKAPASRLKAFYESVVFSRHVLGVEPLQQIVDSRRCLGAASQTALTCPRQATPFTVEQLRRLHTILREGDELWDQAMCGMILFCTYCRSRWSDAQHAEELILDKDEHGALHFLEIKSSVHKTARSFHLRHMFLPVAAPATGVTNDCWGEQWMRVRNMLQIEDLSKFPLMPAPDSNLDATVRPVSTSEAKKWVHYLLGPELVKVGMKISSHSCKCTCLSFLAKRGANYEDRLVLGYHTNKLRVAMTYSRDSSARPLALLSQVLREIRDGTFEPDCTRSGRLKPGAQPLSGEQVVQIPHVDKDFQAVSKVSSNKPACDEDAVSISEPCREGDKPESVLEVQEPEGHVTTDSSDSSGPELAAWAPVVGHCIVDIPADKQMWLNSNSKMCHLSHSEHVKVLLCGRRITNSFKKHDNPIRFDAAKCRTCFRLRNSEH